MSASEFPRCPHCNGYARPHILMWGDMEYVGHPEQDDHFNDFLNQSVDAAVLVGSSGMVPTNDYIAAQLQNRGTQVININPDPSANAIVRTPYFLPLKSREAFEQLDDALG
jgi:NAD-dependent SIR2 family protein deacetylase